MFPRRPGPSSTVSGCPVSTTGSPGRTPDVSSYTWIVHFSLVIRMTSPMSCSAPTSMTSYIRGIRPVAVTTGPATRVIAPTPFAFVSVLALAATRPPHLNRSTPMARRIFVRRSSDSVEPTAMTTGRATVSSRRRIAWLSLWTSPVSRTRMPTAGSSSIRATLASRSSFVADAVFRTPTSLNPCTKSSRPTAAISISHHQKVADHACGEAALLPARNEPDVLDLAVLPDDVVEDREDGQGVQVRVSRGLDEMDFLHAPNQEADPAGLRLLEVRGDVVVERIVLEVRDEVRVLQARRLLELLRCRLDAAAHEDVPVEARLGEPRPQEGFQVDDVDLLLDETPE